MMKANYEGVPQWWFYSILVVVTALSIFVCEGFDHQLQLPYWGVLLAIAMSFVFTLPIGIISATTTVVRCMLIRIKNLHFLFFKCFFKFTYLYICVDGRG